MSNALKIDSWVLRGQVADHLTSIVKNRSIVLTGDVSHLSIERMINDTFANIDAPRRYDFQEMEVHEQDALRSLLWVLPEYTLPMRITAQEVEQAIAGKAWLETHDFPRGGNKCYDCAQPMGLKFKGACVEVFCQNVCEHNREFCVEIDFPTGVVVFADWPDHFADFQNVGILTSNNESVNYLKGRRQTTENYARKHILHHSVGNTSPSWYFNAQTNAIQIGAVYNEDTDEEEISVGFERKGRFCTDLWWVTMVDEQHYISMLSQSGVDEPKHDKNKRACITPGRYRFTCYGRAEDGRVNARGERIGECGEAPVFDAASGRTILSVVQAAGHSRALYPPINKGDDVLAMFNFLNQNLNVIGNGVRNYGDFLSHHSLDVGETVHGTPLQWNAESVVNVRGVYPNFKKEHSLVWSMPLTFFPTDWLEAAVWFYKACGAYFQHGAEGYHNAYPSTNSRNSDANMRAAMNKHRTEDMSDADFYAVVSKKWGAPFDGDVVAFGIERWRRERERIDAFISETLLHLTTELQTRNS